VIGPAAIVGVSLAAVSGLETGPAPVAVIGAGLDLGAGRRGVDMGPSAIRIAGVTQGLRRLGFRVEDDGDVGVPAPESRDPGPSSARYVDAIYHVCNRLRLRVRRSLEQGEIPLVMGGDHSIAVGTVAGVAEHFRGQDRRVGLVWVDAHADMNTPETSPSGNVHGMPLAAALGVAGPEFESDAWPLPAVDSSRVAIVGARQLDDGEKRLIRELEAHVYTMSDLDRRGVEPVIEEALEVVAGDGFVHVSLDMDALDPEIAPGVGTPVRGGLSYREAHLALELVADSGLAGSLDVVEVNPILDRENATALLAVDLVASALGARIL
jgi:arginase